jgi:hypothetical protein
MAFMIARIAPRRGDGGGLGLYTTIRLIRVDVAGLNQETVLFFDVNEDL